MKTQKDSITMNYTQIVTTLIRELTKNNTLFTVYDITRLIRFKNPGVTVDHDKVRSVVENLFFNNAFSSGYSRRIGDHLNIKPDNPQVYYNSAVSKHTDYKPDTLDPSRLVTTHSKGLVVEESLVKHANSKIAGNTSTRVFAVKLKGKNVWRKPYSRGKGSTTNFAEASVYANKNGPSQLLRSSTDPSKWEIVEYELTYKPI